MAAPTFNDRIISEGFPEGWYIQDRLDDDVALLIAETPGLWPGSRCVCLRPRAMRTDDWLHMAREIAHAVVDRRQAQLLLTETKRRRRPTLSSAEER